MFEKRSQFATEPTFGKGADGNGHGAFFISCLRPAQLIVLTRASELFKDWERHSLTQMEKSLPENPVSFHGVIGSTPTNLQAFGPCCFELDRAL